MQKLGLVWLEILLFGLGKTFASHIVGGEVSYECLNACTTRVHVTYFRDCTGILPVPPTTFTWNNLSGSCSAPVQLNSWTSTQSLEITPTCPGTQTWCSLPGSALFGVERYHYFADFETCSSGTCEWELQVSECCRNASITTFANPSSSSVGLMRTQMQTSPGFCNSSPVWEEPGLSYIYYGQPSVHNLGAYDPDGDSLVFVLDSCWHSSNQPISYSAGFSPQAPLGPSWNVSLDRETGEITFIPNPGVQVVGVICMLVKEYRNGVQIGQVQRDIQVTVINHPTTSNPGLSMPMNLQGAATLVGNSIYMCAPGPICFDILSSDLDVSQTLTMVAHGSASGATFTSMGSAGTGLDTLTGTGSTPPAGTFCWTPPSAGVFYVWFEVNDDACPLNGRAQRVIRIVVGNNSYATASATPAACPLVQFSSNSCMGGSLTYQWVGAGGFNSSLANPVHTYPGPGSYPWELIIGNGMVADTIRDTVTIDSISFASLLSGNYTLNPCLGQIRTTVNGPAGYAAYEWSTGASTQDLTVFLGDTYDLTVTDAQGCRYRDSIEVTWVSPDVYGIATTSLQTPLQNQVIFLIDYNPAFQTLTAIDSAWTDSSGFFFFCNIFTQDTTVFLKAVPRLPAYPNEMPTYADSSLFWSGALNIPLAQVMPLRHDLQTLGGVNPGGPGFIGGLISQGANKQAGVGDPVPGLDVFILDSITNQPLAHRVTGADGRFNVSGLPVSTYKVVVDKPMVNNTDSVPVIQLTAQNLGHSNLDFRLHSTYLELAGTLTLVPEEIEFNVWAAPNPFMDATSITLQIPENGLLEITVFDLLGRTVESLKQEVNQGLQSFRLGSSMKPGTYFATITVGERTRLIRLIKVE